MPARPPALTLSFVAGAAVPGAAVPGCFGSGRAPREDPEALHLPLSRRVRERFGLDASLFSFSGRVIFADLGAVRRLAEAMSRELAETAPELALALTPGRLSALGTAHELYHALIARYRQEVDGQILAEALAWLGERLGPERLRASLLRFAEEFPPLPVWRREVSPEEFLEGETAGRSHREILLEEMFLLWLIQGTPALAPFRELFDDGPLYRETAYPEIIAGLEEFLTSRPPFPDESGETGESRSLFAALRAPALAATDSLTDLVEELQRSFPVRITAEESGRLLRGLDLLKEEERPLFPPGPGPVEVEVRAFVEDEPEAFTPDRAWMPRVVMVAKNTFVWLDQLSRAHGREITRLDEIPDAELDALAHRGFTCLWLIGLWERSRASRRIKQLMGNPEAAASAYSLNAYRIAPELGGDEALENLVRRAAARGLRLGCDMVPNHFGIDSEWVLEHPERFLRLPFSPYRAYRFSGPDLSPEPERVGLYLEDHYYDRTDAAVVFQRVDRASGEITYLYHGNDGTSMPWNDTAQLDYLNPEVREAVLQIILGVARRFPVIRFDAAMTLARRHIRRLWFPAPGEGGAIPSRAEQGMSVEEFERAMPEEFWREVVDRAAVEAPDTLLLAEAFWLMESYFVRTLGMHRVYNSAFMVMLRDEDNAGYRATLKEVLAFDPRILERYVNFMSNPDERTAIDQFGDGDKYFAVATLLATLPGLPMFGHGQVEGLAERYGMEYRKACYDEAPSEHLIARHEREIFPLFHRRPLFAGAEHFQLYDFITPAGTVDEHVFACSNQAAGERALVVVHNRFGTTEGRLRRSAPVAIPVEGSAKPRLVWTTLGEALLSEVVLSEALMSEAPRGKVPPGETLAPSGSGESLPLLLTCRDLSSGLEYLFDAGEILRDGLSFILGPYQHHVFVDFVPVEEDVDGHWGELCRTLSGRGVPSLAEALLEPRLQPVLEPFRALLDFEHFDRLPELAPGTHGAEVFLIEVEERHGTFVAALRKYLAGEGWELAEEEAGAGASPLIRDLERALRLAAGSFPAASAQSLKVIDHLAAFLRGNHSRWGVLYAWLLVRDLGRLEETPSPAATARAWLDDLLLARQLIGAFQSLGLDEGGAREAALFVKVLTAGHLPPLSAGEEPEDLTGGAELLPAAEAGETRTGVEEADESGEEEEPPGEPAAAVPEETLPVSAEAFRAWLAEPDVRLAVRLHRFEGATYVHQESFAALLDWGLLLTALAEGPASPALAEAYQNARALLARGEEVGWKVEEWFADRSADEQAQEEISPTRAISPG